MQEIEKQKSNMYIDSKEQINWMVGCLFCCSYCDSSFKAQMKRQMPTIDKNGKKRGCQLCYDYTPHFHEERLKNSLRRTYGDEFIWACSSADIYFAKEEWMEKMLERVRELSNRTFFFQTKNPVIFYHYDFPENCLLGITLENNDDELYKSYKISKAPLPSFRHEVFSVQHSNRKVVTIEPILDFDLEILVQWVKDISPERVYIGYDSHKCYLPEPELIKTRLLINELKRFTKVKPKLLREKIEKKEVKKKN